MMIMIPFLYNSGINKGCDIGEKLKSLQVKNNIDLCSLTTREGLNKGQVSQPYLEGEQ